ncbi:MAG: asparagine synthase (glutamine-hydrolyzing) [Elusimicrobia bacterium]|nr:asparagine synthase (glutamine-hydrolyzing) [Elusimicrobiota bacterium]
MGPEDALMCGIAGFLGPRRDDEAGICATLARSLAHRGPDGEGTAGLDAGAGRRLALVHRRLAILDLSENGRQPMRDEATGNTVVFNGEIYNFRELRAELEAAGDAFRSRSDTEVLLRGYARWGEGVLDRLQGMFAFALWDAGRRRLLLAVDPLGVKPLYWRRAPDGSVAFASEVRALLEAGLAERRADPEALQGYLAYGAVQGPVTAVRGVRSLQAGTLLWVDADGRAGEPRAYWRPRFARDGEARPGRKEAVERLRALLDAAARDHLVSDVPVALFLSGGVDSSALAAFAARHQPGLKTFSVGFAESEWSEAGHARLVASRLGLEHRELVLSDADLLGGLPAALDALDQPTLDGTNVFVISQAVRDAGVKVALSGQGGDEVFGGYSTFRDVPRALKWGRPLALAPAAGRAAAAAWSAARRPSRPIPDKIGQFLAGGGGALEVCMLLRQVFAPETRRALFPAGDGTALALPAPLEEDLRSVAAGAGTVDAVSWFELRGYLGQMLLRDGDVMSMAHSLEVRVPFLDRRVVEFVASLPGEMKMDPRRPKPLLLDAAAGAVPDEVWSRPKQGFTFPWEEWLRGRLKPLGDEAMNDAATFRGLGFEPREVRRLWDAFQARRPGLSWSRVWALIALREWAMRRRMAL